MENFNPPFIPGDQEQQREYEDFMSEPVIKPAVEVAPKPDLYFEYSEIVRKLVINYGSAATALIGLRILGCDMNLKDLGVYTFVGGSAFGPIRFSKSKKFKDRNAESNN